MFMGWLALSRKFFLLLEAYRLVCGCIATLWPCWPSFVVCWNLWVVLCIVLIYTCFKFWYRNYGGLDCPIETFVVVSYLFIWTLGSSYFYDLLTGALPAEGLILRRNILVYFIDFMRLPCASSEWFIRVGSVLFLAVWVSCPWAWGVTNLILEHHHILGSLQAKSSRVLFINVVCTTFYKQEATRHVRMTILLFLSSCYRALSKGLRFLDYNLYLYVVIDG